MTTGNNKSYTHAINKDVTMLQLNNTHFLFEATPRNQTHLFAEAI